MIKQIWQKRRWEYFTCSITCFIILLISACGATTSNTLKSSPTPSSTSTPTPTPSYVPPNTFFDDFGYNSQQDMAANGWIIRKKPGGPGSADFTWTPNNVSFIENPEKTGDKMLQLVASTNGTSSQTNESLVCHVRNYLEGTYAARIKFYDQSSIGIVKDDIVEAFYTISPLVNTAGANYSELDVEYLPNGGWGGPLYSLYMNTWRTSSDRLSKLILGSQDGWHTIVIQATNGTVKYYLDNKLIVTHGSAYFPHSPMSINFSMWFASLATTHANTMRQYTEQIDWVYFSGGQTLTTDQVTANVMNARQLKASFMNSVDAWPENLPSPCNF
jgi:hypothetical protein